MKCGDDQIDGLLAGDAAVTQLCAGQTAPAVGFLQDLLRGHGYLYLPDAREAGYCNFGSATRRAVSDYRTHSGLSAGETADSAVLKDLVQRPAPRGAVGPAYNTLVLDTAFSPTLRFVWLTSMFETSGVFARLNLNTDRCGLSFGVLQWSQRSGQLHGFLAACAAQEPDEWARLMGGDCASLLDYLATTNGGLAADGSGASPQFELTKDPWQSRFNALGTSRPMQRAQLRFAEASYDAAVQRMRPWLRPDASERAVAFLLDLNNQFGPGRVAQYYQASAVNGTSEASILKRMEDTFTALARPEFQPQVRARREFFRTTKLLSDEPFNA
jgi:hypothetical protein